MPSLSDIANDVKNTLNQIKTNTQDTADTVALVKGDTADLNTKVADLITVNAQGFANLGAGLSAILQQQQLTNFLLDHQRLQNDTIICWLDNIADVLCRQLHRQNRMVALLGELRGTAGEVRDVLERVHGDEAMAALRQREALAKIEECCPPDEEEPEPCFEPCKRPEFRPPNIKDPKYKPLREAKVG